MKKSFPLIIFALLINASSLFAQLRFNYDSIIRIDANDNVIRRELYTYDRYGTENSKTIYEWSDESLTLEGNSMYEKTYDANGNVLLDYQYQWDSNNRTWINYRKTVMQYDANGNCISSYHYVWNTSSSAWIGSSGRESEYDENSHPIVNRILEYSNNTGSLYVVSEVLGTWPDDIWGNPLTSGWMEISQVYSRRNENDELIFRSGYDNIVESDYLTVKEYYSSENSDFPLHTGTEYIVTYPDTSLVTEISHIHNSVYNLFYFSKYESVFDVENRIYTSVIYNDSPDSSFFMPKRKTEMHYNSDSLEYLRKYYKWDSLENTWEDSLQIWYYKRAITSRYAVDTLKITERWNLDLQDWENFEKEVILMDAWRNFCVNYKYGWNFETQSWVEVQGGGSYKSVARYDENGYIITASGVYWNDSTQAYSDTSFYSNYTYNELGQVVFYEEYPTAVIDRPRFQLITRNYTYNSDGNVDVVLFERHENDGSVYYSKTEYLYDMNGNKTEVQKYEKDDLGSDYIFVYTDYYYYTQPSLYFGRGADVDTVFITAEGDWTVRSDVDWISFSPASGSGNGYFIVSVEENTGLEDRYATLVVVSDQEFSLKEEQTQQIVITQVGTGSGTSAIAEQSNEAVIATNSFASTLTVETDKQAKLELYSYSGQLVMASSIEGSETISLSGLPAGVYQAVIVCDNKVTKETIVVK